MDKYSYFVIIAYDAAFGKTKFFQMPFSLYPLTSLREGIIIIAYL